MIAKPRLGVAIKTIHKIIMVMGICLTITTAPLPIVFMTLSLLGNKYIRYLFSVILFRNVGEPIF